MIPTSWKLPLVELPWQKSVKHIPQALCITGPEGIGKKQVLIQLASLLLCERFSEHLHQQRGAAPKGTASHSTFGRQLELSGDHKACGTCKTCRLIQQGEHTDLCILQSETLIGIDQIRHLIEFAKTTAGLGYAKVAMIPDIDAMTVAAANALLKILEEPVPQFFILSSTSALSQLLPTICSRLQIHSLPNVPLPESETWIYTMLSKVVTPEQQEQLQQGDMISTALKVAFGAPLKALAILVQHLKIVDHSFAEDFPTSGFISAAPGHKSNTKKANTKKSKAATAVKAPQTAKAASQDVLTSYAQFQQGQYNFSQWGLAFSFQLMEVAFAEQLEKAPEQGSRLWKHYLQLQEIKANLKRSPQLNKTYLFEDIEAIATKLLPNE